MTNAIRSLDWALMIAMKLLLPRAVPIAHS